MFGLQLLLICGVYIIGHLPAALESHGILTGRFGFENA